MTATSSITAPIRTSLPRFRDRRELGEARLRVSPFCLGAVTAEDTVCAAFDHGINFFFLTADMHWPGYEHTRRGLAKLLSRNKTIRDDVVVAVASYVTQPEFCRAPFTEVLQSVRGLERIDVAILGGAYGGEFCNRVSIYQDHRQKKFCGVRAIGASFHDRSAALLATSHQLVDISLLRYNPAHPGARQDVFPAVQRGGSTLLYNFNSTRGFVAGPRLDELRLPRDYWRPHITDYYRFALTRPEFDGQLCAPQTPAELDALDRALQEGPLDPEQENYLINLAQLDRGAASLHVGE
jgi:aryl-alcohol dehydrogenase-like predicted oxidoreductase